MTDMLLATETPFIGRKKGAFAGVRTRVLLSQQQERMTQIAALIEAAVSKLGHDPIAVSDLIEISKKVTYMLGAMNDIMESGRSGEIHTTDFDDENLDAFLKNTSIIASIIESHLHRPKDGQS
jgi:hypothetical protein